MTNDKEYIPKSALSVHAHPDDQDFTVAGTLAKWARAGSQIVSVIITSGDAGSNDPSRDPDYKPELARLREDEQRAANKVLGVQETIFLKYPDGELVASIQLRRDLTRLIRRYRPEVVVTGDPSGWFYGNEYINHPDHRAAAEAATYAVFPSAGTRMIFPELLGEGLLPHDVRRLYVHGNEKPDTWIDIGDTMDLKIEALKKHISQGDTHEVDDRMRKWAEEDGKQKGIKYAESFRVMILKDDEDHRPVQ
jgi:LmbE family N-acetylglucosaminyl deacetylase